MLDQRDLASSSVKRQSQINISKREFKTILAELIRLGKDKDDLSAVNVSDERPQLENPGLSTEL